MGLVHFDQATKHYLLALYMRAPLSLVLSLSQAQAGSGNQTHPILFPSHFHICQKEKKMKIVECPSIRI
jgi:hypothetical protein